MSLEQNKLRTVVKLLFTYRIHMCGHVNILENQKERKRKKEKKKPHKSVTKNATSSIILNSYTSKASMPGIPRSLESRSHGGQKGVILVLRIMVTITRGC